VTSRRSKRPKPPIVANWKIDGITHAPGVPCDTQYTHVFARFRPDTPFAFATKDAVNCMTCLARMAEGPGDENQ